MIIDSQNPCLLPGSFVAPDWVYGATKVKQPDEITEVVLLTGEVVSQADVQGNVDQPNN